MTFFLLVILFLEQVALIGWGLLGKGRIYQLPFLASVVFVGFVYIQLIGLYKTDYQLPEGALDNLIVMTILCLAMIYLGNQQAKKPLGILNWYFNEQKLLYGSIFLTLFGAFFFFKISRLPEELITRSQWSGIIIAYRFFATTLSYGFALAAILYFRTGRKLALVVLCFGAMFYLDRIIIGGRRATSAEFFFIIVLAIWFAWKIAIPKSIMLFLMIAMTLGLHSTGEYRHLVRDSGDSPFSAIENIDFINNINSILEEGGTELRVAAYKIAATELTSNYDFGAVHWNSLIFNYVPAQIFGSDFKRSLTISIAKDDAYIVFGFQKPTGATSTGMFYAFRSFWFFGCIEFYLIGFILKKIYLKAQLGDIAAQLFYMIMMGNALHAITHETDRFFSPLVHMAIFLLPILWYARKCNYSLRSLKDANQFG